MAQSPPPVGYSSGPDDWIARAQALAPYPFLFGAPIGANPWGTPSFPQPTAFPSSSSPPPTSWPFTPAAPQSSDSYASGLPDWWIASRSLLGAIPRQLNKPAGSDGLLGLLAQPTTTGGFFPSDEIGINKLLAGTPQTLQVSNGSVGTPRSATGLGAIDADPTVPVEGDPYARGGSVVSVDAALDPDSRFESSNSGELSGATQGSNGNVAQLASAQLSQEHALSPPDFVPISTLGSADPSGRNAGSTVAEGLQAQGSPFVQQPSTSIADSPLRQLIFQASANPDFPVQPVKWGDTQDNFDLGRSGGFGDPGGPLPAKQGAPSNGIQVACLEDACVVEGIVTAFEAGLLTYKIYKAIKAQQPVTGRYRDLSGTLPAGWQANHLNQRAVYQLKINPREALTVAMQGDVNTPGSPHYAFHQYLEKEFWDDYREGGRLYGDLPTNAQYGQAMKRALNASGLSPYEAFRLAHLAALERASAGLDESAAVPRIPARIRSIK